MRLRVTLLTALCFLAIAPPAQAHGIEMIARPLVVAAAVFGFLGGLIAGGRRMSTGVGLGLSFAAFMSGALLVLLAQALQESLSIGDLALVALLALTLGSFAGAIPLALAFFVAFKISTFIRQRQDGANGARGGAP